MENLIIDIFLRLPINYNIHLSSERFWWALAWRCYMLGIDPPNKKYILNYINPKYTNVGKIIEQFKKNNL
jgi:hypothetical protein